MTSGKEIFLHYSQWIMHAALETTKAYSDGFSFRLIPIFDNIEVEAEKVIQEHWDNSMTSTAYEGDYYDHGDLAEAAQDAGNQMYQNLSFVRQQLIGLSIAGLYHLWERTLKQFIEKEFRHYSFDDKIFKDLRKANFEEIVELLQQFDHDLTKEPYYNKLDELRLIANTIKHGEGKSCDDLIKVAPHLFDGFLKTFEISPTAQDLALSPEDFRVYTDAVTQFWMLLPTKMVLIARSNNAT